MAGALKVATMDGDAEAKLVADLKQKHGISEVHLFTAESGEQVYVRMPAAGVWRRFRSHMADERKRAEAGEILLRSSLLHPVGPAFDAMLEARPGLLDLFAGLLMELGGLQKGAEKKVL